MSYFNQRIGAVCLLTQNFQGQDRPVKVIRAPSSRFRLYPVEDHPSSVLHIPGELGVHASARLRGPLSLALGGRSPDPSAAVPYVCHLAAKITQEHKRCQPNPFRLVR